MNLGYIDAASGSMLLQIILGGMAAMGLALKMWWRGLLRFLHIRKPEDDERSEPAMAAPESEAAPDPVREPVGKH
jgi:hypothetical protein